MTSTGFEHTHAPSKLKAWLLVGCITLLSVGLYVLRSLTRDSQIAPPRLIGDVWVASVDGAPRVYFVTREDRAEARTFDIEGMHTYEHTYSLYVLHSRAASDGAAIGATQIARLETTSADFKKYIAYRTLPDGPGILGPQADVLWLWNNSPEARSLRTLEPVWTQARLKDLNPERAALLPDDPKYARVSEKLPGLVLKCQDASYFQVDRESGKLLRLDESAIVQLGAEPSKSADAAFVKLEAGGRSINAATSERALCRDAAIDNGAWLGLLTSDARERLKSDTGGLDNHELGYKRLGALEEWYYHHHSGTLAESPARVYRGAYTLVPERNFVGRTEIRLDPGSITPLGTESFLAAGLLARPNTTGIWYVDEAPVATTPAAADLQRERSVLILHRKSLKKDTPWQLTRLAIDGTIRWTVSTGLNELQQLSDGHGSIVILGTADASLAQATRPGRIVFVNEQTGALQMLNIANGEMNKAENH